MFFSASSALSALKRTAAGLSTTVTVQSEIRIPKSAIVSALVLALTLLSASPAFAWAHRTHGSITEEAVQRLPEPLRGLLAEPARLKRLQEASIAPDDFNKPGTPHYKPEEAPKHFLDLDAITKEPYPFKTFPRDRAAAEKQFGTEPFQKFGTAPWAAADALVALADALAAGRTADIFRHAGDMAHFAADLHQPFHVTKNFDGQAAPGAKGVHKRVEIGLIVRYADFYAVEVRKGRADVPYLDDPTARLFDWAIEAAGRVQPILDADAAARKATGYVQSEKKDEAEKEMEDPAHPRSKAYYAAFKKELEARGSPEAAGMRDAAAHTAALFYTAWVRAGKPLSLEPPPPKETPPPPTPYWLIFMAIGMLALLLWPRRRPVPPPSE